MLMPSLAFTATVLQPATPSLVMMAQLPTGVQHLRLRMDARHWQGVLAEVGSRYGQVPTGMVTVQPIPGVVLTPTQPGPGATPVVPTAPGALSENFEQQPLRLKLSGLPKKAPDAQVSVLEVQMTRAPEQDGAFLTARTPRGEVGVSF